MTEHSPDRPSFSLRSMFTPLPTSTNMPPTENQPKQLPQLAGSLSPHHLHPAPEYDGMLRRFHQHGLSDSTNTIGSNDSSPTTTISTVDDSSATEPSPGSSPESPPPTTFSPSMLRPRTADESRRPFFELQKQPPPRKGRNLKNLAVNTSRQSAKAASSTSLPLQPQLDAANSILSPSFVKPPTPPRRRPSNLGLTILTPGGSKPPPQEVKLTIPPTPAFGRPGTLRHFQSSPSLPLVTGLSFPHSSASQNLQKQRALETIFSPIEPQGSRHIEEEEEEEEENFDVPLSREKKLEAYPEGPICVYEPGIDLYLEPTAEQARRYDVILNVASEVKSPFAEHTAQTPAQPDMRLDGGGGIQYAPKRDRSAVQDPVTQASETSQTEAAGKDPEYIHIPWEHNSDIVPDLLRLVKLIDDRVSQKKRVLIHCQCGVSRSASLVVAYGLYKQPAISVQEAYDTVKKRSKWIGPNMNLIMQLQEFRSSLARGGILSGNRGGLSPLTPSSAMSDWNGPFSVSPPSLSPRDVPMSAVEPPRPENPSGEAEAVSPGPSSAPSGFPWPTRVRAISAVKQATAYVDPSGHVVPVLNFVNPNALFTRREATMQVANEEDAKTPTEFAVSSPRSTEFAMTALQPSNEVDPADSFGIMSPTSTEFSSSTFDRSALLASLGMGSMRADEETPRRSLSLRHRENRIQQAQGQSGLSPQPGRKLRGKISSPTLREQQQLQSLQAKIEATLPSRNSPLVQLDDAPMSPRATEFTNNPFALIGTALPGSTQSREAKDAAHEDPRSPAQKGANPITRNILDVL